jgi:hypothetical protein
MEGMNGMVGGRVFGVSGKRNRMNIQFFSLLLRLVDISRRF